MEYILVAISSLLASFLTFYSGFGLGTILMPIVAIFFPLPIAIGLTAVVHLLHNLLKTELLWKSINWKIVRRFGLTASVAAIPGAFALHGLSEIAPLHKYSIFSINGEISILHLFIGLIIILFASTKIFPGKTMKINNLFLGGALSGFFGGLSGHQGVFRSAFLINMDLSKEGFIGTNGVIATMVDIVRLSIYGWSFWSLLTNIQAALLIVAAGSALVGIGLGMILLRKLTLEFIQKFIIVLLFVLGMLLIIGII